MKRGWLNKTLLLGVLAGLCLPQVITCQIPELEGWYYGGLDTYYEDVWYEDVYYYEEYYDDSCYDGWGFDFWLDEWW